ncbi:AAA family ATPase [Desulfonatronum parangueonense]
MSYLEYLGLAREPFAPTADPDFLYRSGPVAAILDGLEIAVLLRRGACVCLGGPGSGKTMLCQALAQRLQDNDQVEVLPVFRFLSGNLLEFMHALHHCVTGNDPQPETGFRGLLEAVKASLLDRAAGRDGANMVLCVDEGQRLTPQCLEVFRELLNLESRDGKLLQVVIFAQPDFERTMERLPSFADRVSDRHRLAPLTRHETRSLIQYRLQQAGMQQPKLFSSGAFNMIHAAAQGMPRRVVHLAHKALLALVAQNRDQVRYLLARSCAVEQGWTPRLASGTRLAVLLFIFILLLAATANRESITRFFLPTSMQGSGQVQSSVFHPSIVVEPYSPGRNASASPENREGVVSEESEAAAQPIESINATVKALSHDLAAVPEAAPEAANRPEGLAGIPAAVAHERSEAVNDLISSEQLAAIDDPGKEESDLAPDAASPPGPDARPSNDADEPQVRYLLQVGAFTEISKADSLYAMFRKQYDTVAMNEIEFNGRTFHIVYLAEFSNADDALDQLRVVKEKHGANAYVVEMAGSTYRPLQKEQLPH